MTPLTSSSWSLFFEEFNCRGCGGQEAYQSRSRGFFERFVLPFLFLQLVRCNHCFIRSYIPRTIEVRARTKPARKQPQSEPSPNANCDSANHAARNTGDENPGANQRPNQLPNERPNQDRQTNKLKAALRSR